MASNTPEALREALQRLGSVMQALGLRLLAINASMDDFRTTATIEYEEKDGPPVKREVNLAAEGPEGFDKPAGY